MSLKSFWKRRFNKQNEEDPLVPLLFGEQGENNEAMFFPEVAEARKNGAEDVVKQLLLEKTESEESRLQIFAWSELRNLSVIPDESIAKKVLGFVIEVGMNKGVDYLAVYSDNAARYYNFSGAKIIYQCDEKSINEKIQKLLYYCERTVKHIGLWEGARRSPPMENMCRINFLTPAGLFFGEGPMRALEQDPLSKDIIVQATTVMKSLIVLYDKTRK